MYPLLAIAIDAYRDSLRRSQNFTLTASDDALGRELLGAIAERVPPDDVLPLSKCSTARIVGLCAAQQGSLAEAEQSFRECHATLDAAAWLMPESRMLALTFLRAAEAYLAYRHGETEQARALVYEAMRFDVALEMSYGYTMLRIHRIQLAHNLMKVIARSSCGDAVRLGIGVLNVLEGDTTSWPVPEVANPVDVVDVSPNLLVAMANQIVGEVAIILAGAGTEQARRLFSEAIMHVERRTTGSCLRYAYAHDWLAVKQAFLDREVDCFLMRAAGLLAAGRRDESTLWFATAVDLAFLCNEFNVAGGDIVLNQLANDAQSWERVPSRLLAVMKDLR